MEIYGETLANTYKLTLYKPLLGVKLLKEYYRLNTSFVAYYGSEWVQSINTHSFKTIATMNEKVMSNFTSSLP